MKNKNVIFLCLDALCKSHIGAYGYERNITSNLDRFASQNILFKNAFTAGTWTPPAISSILTGKYPSVPKKMTESEYREYHINIVRNSPKDVYIGLPVIKYMRSCYTNIISELKRNHFNTYAITNSPFLSYFAKDFADHLDNIDSQIPSELAESRALINNSTKFCFEALSNKKLKEPFFLYVHATQPHVPYKPEEVFIKYGSHQNLRERECYLIQNWNNNDSHIIRLRNETGALLKDDYDDNIYAADFYLGKILDYLNNYYGDSMIFFFSDHGEHFYTHGTWYFQHPPAIYGEEMLDLSLEIPLIVKMPAWKNEIITKPVKLIDIFPTVMIELGLDTPQGLDGCHVFKDDGIIKAVCPSLGRVAEKHNLDEGWKIYEVPESPDVQEYGISLTEPEKKLLIDRLKQLGYL
ncbi:MAG: sulfatase-like hydrolase/transferase [bacterium]